MVGPDLRALFITRRWLVTMLACLLALVAGLNASRQWSSLTAWDHAGALIAATLAVAGVVAGRRPQLLWLCVSVPLTLSLTGILAPSGSPPWLPMPNSASYVGFLAITLTGRRVGLAMAFVGAGMVALVWARRSSSVIASALALGSGWIVVVQVLATGLGLWWAWNALKGEAVAADAGVAERESRALAAMAQQERARTWRATATRLHESILNSIHYVLTAPHPDRARLAVEIDHASAAPERPPERHALTLDRVLAEVLADPVAASVMRLPPEGRGLHLSSEAYEATRGALVEIAHNSVRHGGATELRVRVEEAGPGQVRLVAADNGSGLPGRMRPGFGLAGALAEAMQSAGGGAEIRPGPDGGVVAVLRVPVEGAGRGVIRHYPAYDKGRFLMSAGLAGSCLVGIAYFLALGPVRELDRTGGSHYWLTLACGIAAAIVLAALVLRRRRTNVLAGICLVMVPALVPWFLRTAEYGCDQSVAVAACVNVAGFAVIGIACWAGLLPGIAGVVTWATGAAITSAQIPADCRGGVTLALINSLLFLPVALSIALVGVRTDQRASARANESRKAELVERSRAETALELNTSLHGAGLEATSLLTQVARGAPVDDRMRHRLLAVDAQIRAAIQVDSARVGGVALSAKRVVERSVGRGVPVQVRAIESSLDPQPLPPLVEDLFVTAIGWSRAVRPMVQAFTDGAADYLSAVVDEAGLSAAGLRAGEPLEVEGVELQVLAEDAAEGSGRTCSLLARRRVSVPAR